MREAVIKRTTGETDISLKLNLDASGGEIDTGIGFFDHMLKSFVTHSGFYLDVKAAGDLYIDNHHTIEDVGIAFGAALKEALSDKRGIERFACEYVPLDEALVRTVVDISSRSHLIFNVPLPYGKVGEFDTEMTKEFFVAVANNAAITLHIDLIRGENCHHIIEAVFKSFARAIKKAVHITGSDIPSSKGVL